MMVGLGYQDTDGVGGRDGDILDAVLLRDGFMEGISNSENSHLPPDSLAYHCRNCRAVSEIDFGHSLGLNIPPDGRLGGFSPGWIAR